MIKSGNQVVRVYERVVEINSLQENYVYFWFKLQKKQNSFIKTSAGFHKIMFQRFAECWRLMSTFKSLHSQGLMRSKPLTCISDCSGLKQPARVQIEVGVQQPVFLQLWVNAALNATVKPEWLSCCIQSFWLRSLQQPSVRIHWLKERRAAIQITSSCVKSVCSADV